MAVLQPVHDVDDTLIGYTVHCPGCNRRHVIYTANPQGTPNWSFDGDMKRPTFNPSLVVTWHWGPKRAKQRCHSFIRKGRWEFLNDCSHHLAGQTVKMIPVDNSNT